MFPSKFIVALSTLLVTLLAGCATQVALPVKPMQAQTDITVVDKRSPDKKDRKRDALFAPVVLLPEVQYSPTALSVFVDALARTDMPKPANLVIEEFRIADYFPVRLGAGAQGVLGEIIFQTLIDKNTDWQFVRNNNMDPKKDSVLCIVVGQLNGREFKVSSAEPYNASLFAAAISDDPDFKRAVVVAVTRAAEAAARAAKSGG